MAKTRFSIIMDYQNAMRQADRISDAADKLAARENEIQGLPESRSRDEGKTYRIQ